MVTSFPRPAGDLEFNTEKFSLQEFPFALSRPGQLVMSLVAEGGECGDLCYRSRLGR